MGAIRFDWIGSIEYEVGFVRPQLAIFSVMGFAPIQILPVQGHMAISVINLLVDGYKIIRPHEVTGICNLGWSGGEHRGLLCPRYGVLQVPIPVVTRAFGAFEIAGTRQGISQGRIALRGPTPQNTHPARFSILDSGSEGGYFPMAVNGNEFHYTSGLLVISVAC